MIIKEINIRNFRSYYGPNTFKFSKGLTLIVGDNGDGKTTLFEAMQWLFNTTVENTSLENFSEMRKSQMELGEKETVSVSMTFDHDDGEKEIVKSYMIEKVSEEKFRVSNFSFRGYETTGSERVQVNGKVLMDRCFDTFIQRYSMFKGEDNLNVFDNPTALKELVEKFSDIKQFENLVAMSEGFAKKAYTAFTQEGKKDEKIAKQIKKLEKDLSDVNQSIKDIKDEIKLNQESSDLFKSKLEQLEKHGEASERFRDIKDRIESQEKKITALKSQIIINYSTNLLDKYWILCPFPSVFEEYRKKVSSLSKEKRIQSDAFLAQKAKELGKIEALDEILHFSDGVTKLPWYIPDEDTMQEMIDDHRCKVCGQEAPPGSDAYLFMVNKLQEFKKHTAAKLKAKQDAEKKKNEKLFVSEYIEELHNLSISLGGNNAKHIASIASEINDTLAFVNRIKGDIKQREEELQKLNDEKARILIQADGMSEEALEASFKDLKGYFEQKGKADQRISELKLILKDKEAKREDIKAQIEELHPENILTQTYKKVYDTLEKISAAFKGAKEENLRRFLYDLEETANRYLEKLSGDDFHGIVRLRGTANDTAQIKLLSSNRTVVNNPSGSQKTAMYMSVLFAISDLTTLSREENYPLIFDAATSSFAISKVGEFYNTIDKINKQCVIVTKDFLVKTEDGDTVLNYEQIKDLTCSVYRIKKKRPFDLQDLSTIQTDVEIVK